MVPCGPGTLRAVTRGFRAGGPVADVTVITFSIFPELTRIWYYFAEKVLARLSGKGLSARLLIVDCSGALSRSDFPHAAVERFINATHPCKLDIFFRRYIESAVVLVSDDDCFLLEGAVFSEAVEDMLASQELAAWSFFPRPDWWLTVNHERVRPMGSYCLLVNRHIVMKENLSFRSPKRINPHSGRMYDTADYMNEELLKRGYRINLPEGQTRSAGIGGFRGSSIWKALEWGCGRDELQRYFARPFSYEYHLRHNLKSFYIAAKVMDLYARLYAIRRTPLFSSTELREFADLVPSGELKEGILKDLQWVDESSDALMEYIDAERA